MARKSEIRERARVGLDALVAIANSKSDEEAGRHLQTALVALTEAAGHAPIGGGEKKLKEAAKASRRDQRRGERRLLERLGLDETGERLLQVERPDDTVGLLDRLGIDADELR